MNRDDLQRLSKDDLIELMLRLQRPDKTSRSHPNRHRRIEKSGASRPSPGGAKPGHEGHSRKLCETPDAVEDYEPPHCPNCLGPFGADAERELIGEYDEIELPPFSRSFGGIAGSPFAASIAARRRPRLYRLSQWERLSARASTLWRSI